MKPVFLFKKWWGAQYNSCVYTASNSCFLHSDVFVRSPGGPPHSYQSTAASRKPVGQSSYSNAVASPTEGTSAGVVSIRPQSTSALFSFSDVSLVSFCTSYHLYFSLSPHPTSASRWTRFCSVVAQPPWPITIPFPHP